MFGTLQDTYVNVYELKWKEAQVISPFIFVKRSLLKTLSLFSNQAVDFF